MELCYYYDGFEKIIRVQNYILGRLLTSDAEIIPLSLRRRDNLSKKDCLNLRQAENYVKRESKKAPNRKVSFLLNRKDTRNILINYYS